MVFKFIGLGVVIIATVILLFSRSELISALGGRMWFGFIPCVGEKELAETLGFDKSRGIAIVIVLFAAVVFLLIGNAWTFIAGCVCAIIVLGLRVPVAAELAYICDQNKWFIWFVVLLESVALFLIVFTDKFEPKRERL